MSPRPAPTTALLATVLAGALLLGGCSGDDSKTPASTGSGSPSAGSSSGGSAAAPYLPVPDGVELTPQGTQLGVGNEAVVAYEPRQGTVGVLDIRVTSLEKTTFKKSFQGWQLDKRTLSTTPYFVHAQVRNVGDSDLGGRPVPLYIVDGDNTLIEPSTFASSFKPCPSQPFPKKFGSGAHLLTCLVYLAPKHGDLTAVSFRPSQEFNPITWTGEVTEAPAPKPDAGHKSSGGKNKKSAKQ